jgi:hypothetical protein
MRRWKEMRVTGPRYVTSIIRVRGPGGMGEIRFTDCGITTVTGIMIIV